MKRAIMIILAFTIIMTPLNADAKTTTRYATKSVHLYTATKNGKRAVKVKRCQKLTITKTGKTWSRVEYKGQTLFIKNKWLHKVKAKNLYTPKQHRRRGRLHCYGASWTWYTQRRLPGRGLKIPGRHLDKRGFVCDKDDYIVLASSIGYKKIRKVLPTPFGKYGKVYDTNGTWNYGWRDVYTNW